jgi:hypothetical protein
MAVSQVGILSGEKFRTFLDEVQSFGENRPRENKLAQNAAPAKQS